MEQSIIMRQLRSAGCLLLLCYVYSVPLYGNAAVQQVVISPIYGPDVWFSVQSHSTDELTVKGSIHGLRARSIITDDDYKQRFVAMDGKYRIIHTLGKETETRVTDGHKAQVQRPVRDVIRFDLAGIFDSGPTDPIDLIPLYAGHPVAIGDTWTPKAAVKTPFGTGTAAYTFRLDSIDIDEQGHTVARVSVSFVSELVPIDVYKMATTSAEGKGWFLWDCSVNQRRETHIQGIYTLTIGDLSARELLSVGDRLVVHPGHESF